MEKSNTQCQACLGINGPSSRSVVEDKIRKEVERCDRLASFLVIMSMAGIFLFSWYTFQKISFQIYTIKIFTIASIFQGGTGSGVGSFYTEFIKDNYEVENLINFT